MSVLLSFEVESLPDKVKLGYISYPVSAYVSNTLRCYRCPAYGHVAAVGRREGPRCEKCAEGHEAKECVVLGKLVECVNCRGAHRAGDQKCPVRERQVKVSRVRVVEKLSYAEAVKKVEEDGLRGRSVESSRDIPVQRDRPKSEISFRKIGFLAFIAMVIHCTAGMECKLQKIEVVVAAAERYLGVRDLTSEELQGVFFYFFYFTFI